MAITLDNDYNDNDGAYAGMVTLLHFCCALIFTVSVDAPQCAL